MSKQRLVEDGQTIVFLGDSITEASNGYVKVVEDMLGALAPGFRLNIINAGVSGNRVVGLLERIGEDVIAHDPGWITISVGVNDVWHGMDVWPGLSGTPIEMFGERYGELVSRLSEQTAAKLALFTTTVIGEDLEAEANRLLIPYNDFIRQTAMARGDLLVPMNEEFYKAISAWRKSGGGDLRFTTDGVHMNLIGDYLMAMTLLKAWGMV